MTKKRLVAAVFTLLVAVVLNLIIYNYELDNSDELVTVTATVKSDEEFEAQLFYFTKGQLWENGAVNTQCVSAKYKTVGSEQELTFYIPVNTVYIRFDPSYNATVVEIHDMTISYGNTVIKQIDLSLDKAFECNVLEDIETIAKGYKIDSESTDPYIAWRLDDEMMKDVVANSLKTKQMVMKILSCIVVDLIFACAWIKRRTLWQIPKEIISNAKLILNLSYNDFKTKFAGSYFGIIWAFVQPIVTVVVYWFVFEKALNAGTQSTKAGITVPFVLWLIAGLVPWFFFAEVLSSGTNALIEYNYLVKKVVFQISTLPVVKIISSLFVHIFFIAFTIILYSCYHYYPTRFTLQLFYYSFCMIVLCLGLIYATSAVVIFFKDLTQVISIVLQIGMWVTPIMWNMDAMLGRISPIVLTLLKLNPMYYIVSGYRDSLINQIWFWDRPEITLYFWIFVSVLFGLGLTIFKKLQVHFADVL